MSTADHPQTDGQTERFNRVIGGVLRTDCAESPKTWISMLRVIDFALNKAVHASTGFTPFYVNSLMHPPRSAYVPLRGSGLGGGESAYKLAEIIPTTMQKQVIEFIATRFGVLRHVRDAMAARQDKQKEQADAKGRGFIDSYEVGDEVLQNVKNLSTNAVSTVFKIKLHPRFIGPFTIIAKNGLAYTINLPRKLCTHPVLYVCLFKTYHDPSLVNQKALSPEGETSSPLNVSLSRAPSGHPAVAGCTPPSAVACPPRLSGREGSSAHTTEPTQSMTVHERVVLDQESPEVVSFQPQTDPVQSAHERKTLGVASPLTPSLHEPVPTRLLPPA